MKAIRESKEELTGHINQKTNHIQHSLTKIEQSMSTLAEQVQEMETRIGANEDNLSNAQARILKMEKEITFLKEKSDDLENRSRRSNVKIINIPEKSEGTDMIGYVERLIPRLLGEEHFQTLATIERAHRLGRASERTRPILVKFLNFTDKDKVLCLAREKKTIQLSIEVQRKMLVFNEVKKKLREKNIEYATRYPAKLRIRHGERRIILYPGCKFCMDKKKEMLLFSLNKIHRFSSQAKKKNQACIFLYRTNDVRPIVSLQNLEAALSAVLFPSPIVSLEPSRGQH
uniref:L1 transposable element RRM domain-containing protein n=1 Tax=Cyprinodon variegatus TaxID=28743 RepID=A0A3Q2D0X9_CYPVA